ncbi:hypothetical protein L209DRAFT_29251 [Thermothelomyces heterothallicus CBS 203.75]
MQLIGRHALSCLVVTGHTHSAPSHASSTATSTDVTRPLHPTASHSTFGPDHWCVRITHDRPFTANKNVLAPSRHKRARKVSNPKSFREKNRLEARSCRLRAGQDRGQSLMPRFHQCDRIAFLGPRRNCSRSFPAVGTLTRVRYHAAPPC